MADAPSRFTAVLSAPAAHDARVLVLTMNRPEKRNALSLAMYGALADALGAARDDDDVRAVVITGAGSAFCAGNDIADFIRPGADFTPILAFLEALVGFDKPLIAAVNGLAVGIGTTMLLHCDFVYAADSASFRTPFVDLGLVPEAGSSLLLPRMIGYHKAAEMLLMGEALDANEAQRLGLVTEVMPHDLVLRAALARGERLAEKPPIALRQSKALMRAPHADAVRAHIRREAEVFQTRLTSTEARAAFMAFMQRKAKGTV